MKERDHTQMPVAKKERTDHKCLWQRKKDQITNAGGKKKNGCPNQSSKQLTPNERNKTAVSAVHKLHLKTPNGCLPASIRLKTKTTKNKPHQITSLIDYCLQQRSGRLQPLEHRAKITAPMTNRWKAKLTTTNSKLTPH